jgi:hypothetical protein
MILIRSSLQYAIDFCNPAPDAEVTSVGQENFDWVVETTAQYAIERAKAQVEGQQNLTWGTYVKSSATELSQTADATPQTGDAAPQTKKTKATPKAPATTTKKATVKPKK